MIPLLIVLTLLFILPVVLLFIYSFSGIWQYPDLLPEVISTRGFEYLFSQVEPILGSIGSSILYSLAAVGVTLVMCIGPAAVLARYDFKGRTLLEALFLAPVLVPAITFSMGIHYLFIRIGLSDNFLGIVLVLSIYSYPYMLRALVAGFKTFSSDYKTCAENLGAGPFDRILKVELPLLLPAIISGGTVVFLVAFSEYFLVFLIGGGAVPSFSGYLFPLLNSSDRTVASLLTLFFLIVPLVLFFLIDLTVTRLYRKRGIV